MEAFNIASFLGLSNYRKDRTHIRVNAGNALSSLCCVLLFTSPFSTAIDDLGGCTVLGKGYASKVVTE